MKESVLDIEEVLRVAYRMGTILKQENEYTIFVNVKSRYCFIKSVHNEATLVYNLNIQIIVLGASVLDEEGGQNLDFLLQLT